MGEVATNTAQGLGDAFYERLRQQPINALKGLYSGRKREEIIDLFLTALSDGDLPTIAAQKAGALLHVLQDWATDGSETGRIFAGQWLNAEQYAREQREVKAQKLAFEGWLEYVTTKDGLVTRWDPTTGRREPVMQRKFDAGLIKFMLEAEQPGKFGKKAKEQPGDSARDVTDFSMEVPTIEPDEPGPASPIL